MILYIIRWICTLLIALIAGMILGPNATGLPSGLLLKKISKKTGVLIILLLGITLTMVIGLFFNTRVFLGAPLDYHLILGAGLYTFIYIAARAFGKYFGARVGAKATGMLETVQKYLGLALLPHSGVSLVFTGIICSVLSAARPELAVIVQGTIAAAAVINEIIAVIAAKKGFELSGEINAEKDR